MLYVRFLAQIPATLTYRMIAGYLYADFPNPHPKNASRKLSGRAMVSEKPRMPRSR